MANTATEQTPDDGADLEDNLRDELLNSDDDENIIDYADEDNAEWADGLEFDFLRI